jgi:alkylation response protein AidB-like acyl-CoA dehydrogenase
MHAGDQSLIRTMSDEQRASVEAIREFARRECGTREQREAPTEHGREPHNQDLYERIAALGWLGVAIPERYGGSRGGAVDLCLLCEEFSRGQIPMGFFPISMMTARPVERFGSEELKREILGGVVRGRVEAVAMSEPEAGSDVGSLTTRAERADRRLRAQRSEDVDHWCARRRPHPRGVPNASDRGQARGALDDLGSRGFGRSRGAPASRRWAGGR